MRSRTLRRTVAAAVAVPALVFSMAACSDDSGGGKKGGGKSEQDGGGSGGGSGEEKPGPLSKAQLSTALLKNGDVPGYKVRKSAEPLKNENLPPAQAQCKPVLDAFTADSKQKRKAYVGGSVAKGEMTTGQTINQVLLSAYGSGDAETVMSELKSGLKTCKEIAGEGKGGKTEKVAIQESQAPDLGDDSVRFLLKNTTSKSASLSMTVIRSGANTTSFMSLSLGGKEANVPDAVAKKQVAKVEAAQS
ncbi:hypothetical protein [Streptomyces iconiensis]|uniref:Lipoprotein n=1 Tax=Streptomyces iconiensis TaxID=1384038 RepID=A0ABT7A5B4_9ACTN|nr:hypothetical protein [Streptomyces iconiensis]MDJ1136538.1 hypothetical protein [Streptomyces iconiensis]